MRILANMKDTTAHKLVRGLVVFIFLLIVFSLNIGKNFDYNFLGYALAAAVAVAVVYLAIKTVDYFFSKKLINFIKH